MIPLSHPKYAKAAVLLFALVGQSTAIANEIVDEHTRLATLLRELSAIERLTYTEDLIRDSGPSRRHFSYVDLRADIQRVSMGIKSYLSPPRAAPRDVVDLHGSYLNDVVSDQ
ncbi:Conserved hypothetical protein; putative exported protein [Pseudomonas brassicacearum subsp. brassicacearum NFM421]|uniref:Conjugal transfer protein n=1 Tax=Pseudomonas brassicacearum (strain NFM421) TaxID=994484 RepID=F2KF08_PSEBN|nr:RAQPRD family integrative conjugative element protein [Pseudomonas brassicacearum]AEA68234.1 Conserved hypothetical protein; putative exported protein [Pseudomonas brassicacearum subsp. brassicacearum NFM421]